MENDDLDWEDVRVFTVACRSKSYRQAASRLGTTHPTVRRRIASLEATTGLRLFHREAPGLRPTAEGRQLLEAADEVGRAMEGFARRARAAEPEDKGPIRATMPISVALALGPALAAFAERWPDSTLTVDTRPDFADLGAMEADVAIRAFAGKRRPDPNLAGRRAVFVERAAYGLPGANCWIASSRSATWGARSPFPDLPVRFVMPEITLRLDACRRGLGLAMLPCYVADPHLPRLCEPVRGYEVWVLVHPDMRHSPRLRRFRDAMIGALQGLVDRAGA